MALVTDVAIARPLTPQPVAVLPALVLTPCTLEPRWALARPRVRLAAPAIDARALVAAVRSPASARAADLVAACAAPPRVAGARVRLAAQSVRAWLRADCVAEGAIGIGGVALAAAEVVLDAGDVLRLEPEGRT